MVLLFFSLVSLGSAILCSEIDIGTDVNKIGDIVKSGVVQPGWSYHDMGYKSSPPQSELYLYVKGLDLLGPTYEVKEFHHEDEKDSTEDQWVVMDVVMEEKSEGLIKEYRSFKVTQKCKEKEGGNTIKMSLTFAAVTCDPITIHWYKVCGEPTARRENLQIGLGKNSNQVVKDGVVTREFDGNIKDGYHDFGSGELTATLYMYQNDMLNKTYFGEPYIITDHEILYPRISGSMAAGGWIIEDMKELVIEFNCIVDDGARAELILVIELPYFHDLEIHFFKRCGSASESSWVGFKGFFFVLGVIGIGICISLIINRYQQGEEIVDFTNIKRKASNIFKNIKSSVSKPDGLKFSQEKELPSMDSEGKNSLNAHTLYGTA
jgi:hypothetical protein